MKQRIVIRVAPDGETEVRTQGFRGSSCQAASRFIEQALGRTTTEKLTSDYYQPSLTTGTQQQSQGERP